MKIHLANLKLNNFGYIIAIANIYDKHDRSAPSHFHWKILKCRMIIFSNSSILASPDRKDLQQVHIVFNKCGDDYDKLNSLFLKFSLIQHGEIKPTTPEIFQMCFHYTMTARIAPTWNTLGQNHLINNRDFLVTKGPQEGITCNVLVNDEHVLSLELRSIKINLLNNDEVFESPEWIRVLPSLIKATVEEYHEKIPEASKFRSYKDLRRHWKNIHGYRLPEEEGSYYSIQFWRGEPLLYPKLCVIRNYPVITPTPKHLEKQIVQRFLVCLEAKMFKAFCAKFNIENSLLLAHKSNSQESHDTQAVSLCTPTQFAKGISSNLKY